MVDKPYIGAGRTNATAVDLRAALGIYRRTCLLLLVIAGALAWLL
jgi:adenosylcobinamide-phosphate synthase